MDTLQMLDIHRTRAGHQCRLQNGRQSFWNVTYRWYLLSLQLLYSILFTGGITFWLNGRTFTVDNADLFIKDKVLRQSDVTTIVSACLVLSRIISGALQGLLAWRCVFILLEKTGLSLTELSRLASWHIPLLFSRRRGERQKNRHVTWIAVALMLLSWPSQLANPIASGSISWIPTYDMNMTRSTELISTASAGSRWSWYMDYANDRTIVKQDAAGRTNLGMQATISEGEHCGTSVCPSRRMVTQFAGLPNGTVVSNITVPSFNIQSFEWVTDTAQLSAGIIEAIQNQSSGLLTITYTSNSSSTSPLLNDIVGSSVLLKDTWWNGLANTSELPDSPVFEGSKYAAIYVAGFANDGASTPSTCHSPLVPRDVDFVRVDRWNNRTICIAVAELNISAGVVQCAQGDPTTRTDGVCYISVAASGIVVSDRNATQPDPLVQQVFDMMPEVQALATAILPKIANASSLNSTMEEYLRSMLVRSYQGTWSAMTDYLADSPTLATDVWLPFEVLKADVTPWRMYLWLELNLLLVIAGLMLVSLQNMCEVDTVDDAVITAVMLDTSHVIEDDEVPVCDAVAMGRGAGDNSTLRVRLIASGEHRDQALGGSTGHYQHSMLVPEEGCTKSPTLP